VIEAVKGFDEILVCDMESTDRTVEIALRVVPRVVPKNALPMLGV
jgi:hypothetical protein